MIIFLALNCFFMIFFWHKATEAFKEGRNGLGMIDLFFSAFNAAVLFNYVFP